MLKIFAVSMILWGICVSVSYAGSVKILGLGALPCGEWVAVKELEENADVLISWVAGFKSGINFKNVGIGPQLGPSTVSVTKEYVDYYCTKNPDKPIVAAVQQYIEDIDKSNSQD
jgi:hypothetical protein